ncbi:MAG: hypothetical protein LBH48_08955, partial [Bifidobacteriaceae bacterium]|nr:hypothetical protein [Bifidobacteriaceae bacterium]
MRRHHPLYTTIAIAGPVSPLTRIPLTRIPVTRPPVGTWAVCTGPVGTFTPVASPTGTPDRTTILTTPRPSAVAVLSHHRSFRC